MPWNLSMIRISFVMLLYFLLFLILKGRVVFSMDSVDQKLFWSCCRWIWEVVLQVSLELILLKKLEVWCCIWRSHKLKILYPKSVYIILSIVMVRRFALCLKALRSMELSEVQLNSDNTRSLRRYSIVGKIMWLIIYLHYLLVIFFQFNIFE